MSEMKREKLRLIGALPAALAAMLPMPSMPNKPRQTASQPTLRPIPPALLPISPFQPAPQSSNSGDNTPRPLPHQPVSQAPAQTRERINAYIIEAKMIVGRLAADLRIEKEDYEDSRAMLEQCKTWLKKIVDAANERKPRELVDIVRQVQRASWVLQDVDEGWEKDQEASWEA